MQFLVLIVLLSLSLSVSAADDLEDALSGFDDSSSHLPKSDLEDALQGFDHSIETLNYQVKQAEDVNKLIEFSGNMGFASTINTAHSAPADGQIDYRGLSKLRLTADLIADFYISNNWRAKAELNLFYDAFYSIDGRDQYNADTLSTYETEARINELYIQGAVTEDFDIKIGRQIVVWGKSDNLRITDVVNPLDNREPGLVDIEDLRLPILISQASYYSADWSYHLLAIHEQRNPLEPAIGSEFFPTYALPLPTGFVLPDVGEGSIDISKTRLALAIDGRFNGWDLSLYAGRVTDSSWHFENNRSERQYATVDMAGIASNIIVSGFLLKAEMAYLNNIAYNTTTDRKSRLDTLVGVEYMGISDWVLSAEYANRSIQNYEVQMINSPDLLEQNTPQLAIRASYSFDHDNAAVYLLHTSVGEGGHQGGFDRIWLDYSVSDKIQASVGYIAYQSGTNPFWAAIGDNDRVFFSAKYSF